MRRTFFTIFPTLVHNFYTGLWHSKAKDAVWRCTCAREVPAIKPTNMTWEKTASIPLAANTALYFVRDLSNVRAGQTILINGASGAIGTLGKCRHHWRITTKPNPHFQD